MRIEINGINDLERAATEFIEKTGAGKVYAFYGAMGAGKTTLISEIVRQLGSGEEANSPTFSIVNVYDTENWGRIFHLDCYRLEDDEEAFDMGIEDYLNSGNTCFIEWPEKVEGFLPPETVVVTITANEDGQRIVETDGDNVD